MLIAAALLAVLQPGSPPVHWECSGGGIGRTEGFLEVFRRLHADGSFIDDQLGWRSSATGAPFNRMAWSFTGDSPGQIRLDSLFSMIALTREPAGRMRAIIRADGREVSRAQVALPRLQSRDGQGRLLVNVDYRRGPVLWTSERPTAPPPALGEARDIELGIEEEGSGTVIARIRLRMPDWSGTRREVAILRGRLDELARDFRTRCRDITVPVRVELRVGR
jgi:hypothetical protein